MHRLATARGESSPIPSPRPSLPPFTASFPGGPLWKWSENRVSLWLFIKDVCVSVWKERGRRTLKNERVPFPISPQLPPPSPTHLCRWSSGSSLSFISDISAASTPRAPLSPLPLPPPFQLHLPSSIPEAAPSLPSAGPENQPFTK